MHDTRVFRLALAALTLTAAFAAHAEDAALYFPPNSGEWQTVAPEAAGFDPAKLDAALDYAGEHQSSAVVVLYNGRILAERYWPMDDASERYQRMRVGQTPDGRPIEDVASVQKSVVAVLAAIAREHGQLVYQSRVSEYLGLGWSSAHGDQEGEVTIWNLMTMTSGLTPALTYEVAADTKWRYNTRAYAKMVPVLEEATGHDIQTLTRDWLTAPTGMNDSRWAPRPWVRNTTDANTQGFATTARDLARFGLLVLANGQWNGQAIVQDPKDLHELLTPSQDLNPSYGMLWWLNGQNHYRRADGDRLYDGPLVPTAPPDMVAALGALDRKCYVVPSAGLVVTRLGDAAPRGFNTEFWRRLTAAQSKD